MPPTRTPSTPPETVALVLAGGGGSRFSGPGHKLTARLHDGHTIAHHAVAAAVRSSIGPVLVITGAVADPLDLGGSPSPALPTADRIVAVDGTPVRLVHNPRWDLGQSTSLQLGIDAARSLGAAAVVVGLADQPGVVSEAWRRVARSTSPIAVATYRGRRGNPVRLGAEVWPVLLDPDADRVDEGARGLIRSRPDLVEPVPCPGSPDDIDTVEDLQRWQRRSSTSSP